MAKASQLAGSARAGEANTAPEIDKPSRQAVRPAVNVITAVAGSRIPPPSTDERAPISIEKGDVPESVARRYLTEPRKLRGDLGFFADAKAKAPLFLDRGASLATRDPTPEVIRDMMLIAAHRGWREVRITGTLEFRRAGWKQARALGIDVQGYRPSSRDQQETARLSRESPGPNAPAHADPAQRFRTRTPTEAARDPELKGAQGVLSIVTALVRGRLKDPAAQERVIGASKDRIAQHLQAGRSFEPPTVREVRRPGRTAEPDAPRQRPERDRSR